MEILSLYLYSNKNSSTNMEAGADLGLLKGGGGGISLWRARERDPIWGSGGCAPCGVQGQTPGGGLGGEGTPKS